MAVWKRFKILISMTGLFLLFVAPGKGVSGVHDWSADEVQTLRSLSLESLPPVPRIPPTYSGTMSEPPPSAGNFSSTSGFQATQRFPAAPVTGKITPLPTIFPWPMV